MSKYFSDPVSQKQLRCHCGCDEIKITDALYTTLDTIRVLVGRPVNINSGYRCKKHDLKVRQKRTTGAHHKGLAADIRVANSYERFEILRACMQLKITRIGVAEDFIHIDIDRNLPQYVIWTYGKEKK
jgi:uncharacterized protein YcbK (DUF882 family)